MLTGSRSTLDLSQNALYPKLQHFLKNLDESLPDWTELGMCSGYAFMLFRAETVGAGPQYWERLTYIARADHATIALLATELRQYKDRFRALTLQQKHLSQNIAAGTADTAYKARCRGEHYLYLDTLARVGLSAKASAYLNKAIDLYAFISSLIFAQDPVKIASLDATGSRSQRGAISQLDFTQILKFIPPDGLRIYPFDSYQFAFAFSREELAIIFNQLMQSGDRVRLTTLVHAIYFTKENAGYFFYDSNCPNGAIIFNSSEQLVTHVFDKVFFDQSMKQRIAIGMQIYNVTAKLRATPLKVAANFVANRPRALYSQTDQQDIMALQLAAKMGCYEITKYLLLLGINPNVRCSQNYTLAMHAALHGHAHIIDLLADFNAEFDALNNYMESAHGYAQRHNHQYALERINHHQRQMTLTDFLQPLYLSELNYFMGQSIASLRMLLEQSNIKQKKIILVLLAVHAKNISELLILISADRDALSLGIYFFMELGLSEYLPKLYLQLVNDGLSVRAYSIQLILAAAKNDISTVKQLLFLHMHLFTSAQLGITMVYLAAENQVTEIMDLLSQRPDTDPSWQIDGLCAIHRAVIANNLSWVMVHCLNSHAINLLTDKNRTPLALAIENKRYEIIEYFIKYFSGICYPHDIISAAKMLLIQPAFSVSQSLQHIALLELLLTYRPQDVLDIKLLSFIQGENHFKRTVAKLIIDRVINSQNSAQAVLIVVQDLEKMRDVLSYLFQDCSHQHLNKYPYKNEKVTVEWMLIIRNAQQKIQSLHRRNTPAVISSDITDFLNVMGTNRYGFYEQSKKRLIAAVLPDSQNIRSRPAWR